MTEPSELAKATDPTPPPGQQLTRGLGLTSVIATILTGVIGGGLFITTVQVQTEVLIGSNLVLAYLIAAVPAFFVVLCYAVLASAIPATGGDYIYISRVIDPFVGFIVTWVRWLGMVAGIAAISVGDLVLIQNMFGMADLPNAAAFMEQYRAGLAVAIITTFLLINYIGVRIYASVQNVMFFVLLAGLSAYVIAGLPHVSWTQLSVSARGNFDQIMQAASIVFFSYVGFAAIADAGGEVRNANHTLPLGMIIAVILVTLVYVSVTVVTYGAIDLDRLVQAGNIPTAAGLFLTSGVTLFVSFTAFTALISDISPALLASSRLSLAWAQDGIVPQPFTRLSRFQTPKWTLLIIGIVAISIVLFFGSFIEAINITTIAVLMTYAVVCITVLVLPYKRPDLWQQAGFRPVGIWIISILGFLSTSLLLGYLIQASKVQFFTIVIWASLGAAVYHLSRKNHLLEWRLIKEAEAGLSDPIKNEGLGTQPAGNK